MITLLACYGSAWFRCQLFIPGPLASIHLLLSSINLQLGFRSAAMPFVTSNWLNELAESLKPQSHRERASVLSHPADSGRVSTLWRNPYLLT